jgi:hypothetical protein
MYRAVRVVGGEDAGYSKKNIRQKKRVLKTPLGYPSNSRKDGKDKAE